MLLTLVFGALRCTIPPPSIQLACPRRQPGSRAGRGVCAPRGRQGIALAASPAPLRAVRAVTDRTEEHARTQASFSSQDFSGGGALRMAVPKPPRPGQAVTVKFTEPYGECGGCVTRVVGRNVYVCYEGEAHEYEEPLDWTDPAVRRIVRVLKPPPVTSVPAQPRQDRRSRAEKATGWGGPSRRRRRKFAAQHQLEYQPEVAVKHEQQVPDASPLPVSEHTDTVLPRRTASHQLLEHSHETLLSEEQRLEAEARRLEEELERELSGSIASLSLGCADALDSAATTNVGALAKRRGCKSETHKSTLQQIPCDVLCDNLASPTPETSEDADEHAHKSVYWKTECSRLREREKDHLREIREKDRQIKMLQAMLSAAAGLCHVGEGDECCSSGQLALTG